MGIHDSCTNVEPLLQLSVLAKVNQLMDPRASLGYDTTAATERLVGSGWSLPDLRINNTDIFKIIQQTNKSL